MTRKSPETETIPTERKPRTRRENPLPYSLYVADIAPNIKVSAIKNGRDVLSIYLSSDNGWEKLAEDTPAFKALKGVFIGRLATAYLTARFKNVDDIALPRNGRSTEQTAQ